MKNIHYLALLSVAGFFSACTETIEERPESGMLIDAVVSGGVYDTETRVTYDPNSDNSAYIASWREGDEISLFIPNTANNDNRKFTVATTAKTSNISGKIATWEGEKNVYALYPFDANGYKFSASSETIHCDNSTQKIDAYADNVYPNGLMVAVAANATATSRSNYNIGELNFKQVMSLFKLKLKDIPVGERITAMGFKMKEQLLVESANIDPTTGKITPHTKAHSISATVKNQVGSIASLNFAMLPADLTGKPIVLHITTENNEAISKEYTYAFAEGLNFETNRCIDNNAGARSLTHDFIDVGAEPFFLADLEKGFIPIGNTWVIQDETATKVSFSKLNLMMRSLSDQGKTVAFEFPNLTSIPAETFAFYRNLTSASFPRVTTIERNAFIFCESLTTVSFSVATTIEVGAFKSCKSLASVSFPMVTTIGAFAFNMCNDLTTVTFPVATTIDIDAFNDCKHLSSVSFPTVTTIGREAFYGCFALSNISFPAATTIGDGAFKSCLNLTTVSFPVATTIDVNAFIGCMRLSSVSFPVATTISDNAFNACALKEVSFPAVTTIGARSFFQNEVLTTASFPLTTTVGKEAFADCNVLRSLELSTGVDATTNVGVELYQVGVDVFKHLNKESNEGNITLTIGAANEPNIKNNTLTVASNSYTFKKIVVAGGL